MVGMNLKGFNRPSLSLFIIHVSKAKQALLGSCDSPGAVRSANAAVQLLGLGLSRLHPH